MEENASRAALRACAQPNESEIQRALRNRNEVFSAVVLWKPGLRNYDALCTEMRRIKEAGFSAVRFHQYDVVRDISGSLDFSLPDIWLDAAADAGVDLIFHLNDALKPDQYTIAGAGIPVDMPIWEVRDNAEVRAGVEETVSSLVARYMDHSALYMWAGFGEPGAASLSLAHEHDRVAFGKWLEERYSSLANLDEVWNIYPEDGRYLVPSFEAAWKYAEFPESAADINGITNQKKIYGAKRDRTRFLTDRAIEWTKWLISVIKSVDAKHPVSVGSHQLFLNQPALGWDIAEYARIADLHFSSIHLSWHFDAVDGEVDRPVYMQARKTRDYFKGGWTSAYETTGGAVQYSGGYGNAMTVGLMRRLCLSYLAAGNVNLAFWTWNHRPGGWEMGEYGLTSLSGALTPWGKEAGAICKKVTEFAEELLSADHLPAVGLLESWDTDAVLMNEPDLVGLGDGDDTFVSGTKMQACRARIGAARVLINQQIPFSYVSETDVHAGLLECYPVVYAPHLRAASIETLERLCGYVETGGILIGDVQFGFCDQWGKVHPKGAGCRQDRIFGMYVDAIHDARTNPLSINGMPLAGFYGSVKITHADVRARLSDGTPGVTVAASGKGTAIFLNFDSGMLCTRPGNHGMESFIGALIRAVHPPQYMCPGILSYRLSGPRADHFFLVNDGVQVSAPLAVCDTVYTSGSYVLEGTNVSVDRPIVFQVPERSAVWLRMEKGE